MNGKREQWIAEWIAHAGMPAPTAVFFGKTGDSVAVAFSINNVTETIEGCGESDGEMAEDVVRQLATRLRRP